MRTWREPDIEPAGNTEPTPAKASPATAAGPVPTGNTEPTPAKANPATAAGPVLTGNTKPTPAKAASPATSSKGVG